MKKVELQVWRGVFLVSGLFSLVGGIAGFFMFQQQLADAGRPAPVYTHAFQLLFLVVAIFGVGYLMVWRDPWGNRNIVVLGLLSKIAGFVMTLHALDIGELPPENSLQPWVVDLPFGLAFLLFLWRSRGGPDSLIDESLVD